MLVKSAPTKSVKKPSKQTKVLIKEDGSIQAFEELLELAENDPSIKGIGLLCSENNDITESQYNNALEKCRKPIVGGIFPKIFSRNKPLENGCILIGFLEEPIIQTIENVEDASAYDALYQTIENRPDRERYKTMLVFVDCLANNKSKLIDSIFNNFGLDINYIGGGAGFLSFQPQPCLFANNKIFQNGAVLALLPWNTTIGIRHGWTPVTEPVRASKVDGDILIEINQKPAFEVYKNQIWNLTKKVISQENFFEVSKFFPFGISKLNAEPVVRDMLALLPDGSLKCAGEIEENSIITILNSTPSKLIESAKDAAKIINTEENKENFQLNIDCISRFLTLEDRFQEELDAISSDHSVGVCPIGEIANNKKQLLEFYNKTVVVSIFHPN